MEADKTQHGVLHKNVQYIMWDSLNPVITFDPDITRYPGVGTLVSWVLMGNARPKSEMVRKLIENNL